ncbi:alpha-tocopherol transfer protein-like [Tetranychus urticae]|nr:alpha-tocopherol transfer protein-like [Tetranychus urticae]
MADNYTEKLEQLKSRFAEEGISPIVDDPEYLIKFLQARLLDVEKTVVLMKCYLDYKAGNPNMFSLPSRIKQIFDTNLMKILNTRSNSGEALILFRPGAWNPSLFNFDSILSAALISLEMAALSPESQKCGLIMISDMESFGWKQLKHFTPFQAKKLANIMEKIIPLRVNAITIFNQSKFAELAWTVIKPFLSEHLRSRVTFHGADYKHLEGFVQDYKSLPDSLGGQGGQLDCSDFYLNLANNESLFKSFGYS